MNMQYKGSSEKGSIRNSYLGIKAFLPLYNMATLKIRIIYLTKIKTPFIGPIPVIKAENRRQPSG
jgi:hypothetical protein